MKRKSFVFFGPDPVDVRIQWKSPKTGFHGRFFRLKRLHFFVRKVLYDVVKVFRDDIFVSQDFTFTFVELEDLYVVFVVKAEDFCCLRVELFESAEVSIVDALLYLIRSL
jgi:hypothetical protein